MHVVVLGAGVIGVTSAWYLANAGCRVTVIEQLPRPAFGTSFANAGQLSYGYAMPWAAPGVPLKALKWLRDPLAPFKLKLDTEQPLSQALWLARMWGNCNHRDFERNKSRMLALSSYSRESMAALLQKTGLRFDYQQRGTLQVFRTEQQVVAAEQDLRILLDAGVRARRVAKEELLQLEPGLAQSKAPLAGGLFLPDDATGDCHLFTQELARRAEALGVRFEYNTAVTGLVQDGRGIVTGVRTQGLAEPVQGAGSACETVAADVVVLAMGCNSPRLARQVGVSVPVYPVKGYSLTFNVQNPESAPRSTVMDETYKVAITRLGNRVRVGGTAEVCGHSTELRLERRAVLERSVGDLFPQAGSLVEARFWTGLRPSTPDSVPYLGPTRVKGLWVNCGHGTLGWTMACGSGQALAKLITGMAQEVPENVVRPAR